jgi:hypothetical protein
MVAAVVNVPCPAFEGREVAGEQRGTVIRIRIVDVIEQRMVRACEVRRQDFLIVRQNVNNEIFRLQIRIQGIGNLCNIPQHEWRFE